MLSYTCETKTATHIVTSTQSCDFKC